MSDNQFLATVVKLTRMSNSANGNPRYRVYFAEGGSMLTKADSAVNYEIPNHLNKRVLLRTQRTRGQDVIWGAEEI